MQNGRVGLFVVGIFEDPFAFVELDAVLAALALVVFGFYKFGKRSMLKATKQLAVVSAGIFLLGSAVLTVATIFDVYRNH